jgi:hypothetical protein
VLLVVVPIGTVSMKTSMVLLGAAVPASVMLGESVMKSVDDEPVSGEIAVMTGAAGSSASCRRRADQDCEMSCVPFCRPPFSSEMFSYISAPFPKLSWHNPLLFPAAVAPVVTAAVSWLASSLA